MKKSSVTLSKLLNEIELVSKNFNEIIILDDFCSCEAYPLQKLINLRLDIMLIRDSLSELVFQEICAGYSDYFDVLNTAKINADVAMGLIEILIQTKPCCNSNEICNILYVSERINAELCLLVANLVFLTHMDSKI